MLESGWIVSIVLNYHWCLQIFIPRILWEPLIFKGLCCTAAFYPHLSWLWLIYTSLCHSPTFTVGLCTSLSIISYKPVANITLGVRKVQKDNLNLSVPLLLRLHWTSLLLHFSIQLSCPCLVHCQSQTPIAVHYPTSTTQLFFLPCNRS